MRAVAADATTPGLTTPGQVQDGADQALPGGGFLVAPVPTSIFTREQLGEEQRLFAETADRFIRNEVWPRVEAIEDKATVEGPDGQPVPLVVHLVRQACELGLSSIEIPAEYEGLGLDLTTALHVAETLRGCASFAATLGAHNGIGTLPIAFFGSHEQKQRYLPRLASGELLACYALTEPGNGSDALGGKTTAVRSADGTHFLLTGEKQFITNGSWADLAVVFANVDGRYSALIVDLHAPGVVRGAEEKKMGIRGSSTTSLTFQEVKVPVDHLLGEVGDAAKIALNILYVGRMKLGFATMGTAKYAIDLTLRFIRERKQFGRTVGAFDLQQGKLAEMVAWTYACDSLCYRTVGLIDADMRRLPEGHTAMDEMGVMRRWGLECAIVKVYGSETLSRVLYHAVRMHGGYGFCEEYQVERLTRDNVVDTIYEGTNDINRLVIMGELAESAHGRIPFREYLEQVHRDLRAGEDAPPRACEGYLGGDAQVVHALKRALAYAAEQVLIGVGKDVRNEQQVMLALVDGLIALYAAEAALARTVSVGLDHSQARVRQAATRLAIHEATEQVGRLGREALGHAVAEEERPRKQALFERLLAPARGGYDVVALRRQVAEHALDVGAYDL